jgi:hypothetical protein
MHWKCASRLLSLLTASLVAVAITGCPELNQWSGPAPLDSSFMSVADPPIDTADQDESEVEIASSPGWRSAR